MLAKVVAALIWRGGMSAKPSVLRLVNCIDRQRPPKNKIATITGTGVVGIRNEQANSDNAVNRPFPIRTRRNPKSRITGVVTVFIPTKASAAGPLVPDHTLKLNRRLRMQ